MRTCVYMHVHVCVLVYMHVCVRCTWYYRCNLSRRQYKAFLSYWNSTYRLLCSELCVVAVAAAAEKTMLKVAYIFPIKNMTFKL